MSIRLKKFIGMILLVTLVIVYALVAMAVGANFAHSSTLVQLLYFGLSGVLWIVPAMVIIRWMAKMGPMNR